MELTLANVISNLLVLVFEYLIWDIEDFFSSVHFFLQIFPKFLSTKWNSLWRKMQISNTSEPLHQVSCNIENSGDEKRIHIAEINLMMNKVGIVGGLEDSGNNSTLGAEDFLALFDEEEPSLEEIKETFEVFDVNKDGFIDAIELQRVVCNLGLKEVCSLEECKRMIKPFDGNGDGLIDFQQFVKFMEKCLC